MRPRVLLAHLQAVLRRFQPSPFATGDPSRSKELGGVGLGLALVKRTAERWGGDVLLDDGALGGARFRIVVG